MNGRKPPLKQLEPASHKQYLFLFSATANELTEKTFKEKTFWNISVAISDQI